MASLWTTTSADGLTVTAYRGEGSCLLAMDLDENLRTNDFVGFSIEVRYPGSPQFGFLKNLLSFEYGPGHQPPFSSKDSPFQTFRWVHVPTEIPGDGQFTYRVSVATMDAQGQISHGATALLVIDLSPRTVPDFVNIAFTRAFASSQAYDRKFQARGGRNILPPPANGGCTELTWNTQQYEDEYAWLGFESRSTLLAFLREYVSDPDVTLDVLAYDFCEPTVVNLLRSYNDRIRIIIDDSSDHAGAQECESIAAAQLQQTAGADHVKRLHFSGLQHNKVVIAKRSGAPFRVLTGSTNFSLRGMCIQANNLLDFSSPDVAGLYADLFQAYWTSSGRFRGTPVEKSWHDITDPSGLGYSFCFSPHSDASLSLGRVAQAIDGATSSVMFAVAFLYNSSGAVRSALDAAVAKADLFTYGTSDKKGNLTLNKPDGSRGVVYFAALGAAAPPPFKQEWTGGSGISMHHKFVVCDFNGANPTLFTGSSNLSPSGEANNGDNLVRITNPRIVVPYAIEAVKLFDHFAFRLSTEAHGGQPKTLKRPPSGAGEPWFATYFVPGTPKFSDRMLFARRDSR
jgi:phosphatidylserine/phosphatidylglycerophosphate/cardiolipin synthase-like enzyme